MPWGGKRPGAGRKPMDGNKGKTSWLSVRVHQEVRDQLKQAAGKNRVSLATEIDRRLKASLDPWQDCRNIENDIDF